MKSVLYFGDPQGALALLERGIDLCGVVHGRRGGPGATALLPRLRSTPRLQLPDLDDPTVVERLAALKPDLIVAAFYPKRIPAPVLALAPGLNVHPSALPRFRGPDPILWTLRSGDPETEVCVQLLALGLDEGDVLRRDRFEVGPRESSGSLSMRLEAHGAVAIAEVALLFLEGRAPVPVPQEGEVVWAPQLAPEEAEIDWQLSAVEVDRFVRACAPYPGAFTGIGEELLVVLEVRPVDAGTFGVLPPGTPYVQGGCAFIRCGEGAVRLQRLRLGRRPLTGRQLASLLV